MIGLANRNRPSWTSSWTCAGFTADRVLRRPGYDQDSSGRRRRRPNQKCTGPTDDRQASDDSAVRSIGRRVVRLIEHPEPLPLVIQQPQVLRREDQLLHAAIGIA